MAGITDVVTKLINRMIPKSAVTWEPTETGIKYLHPRKGWKWVSWKRVGLVR